MGKGLKERKAVGLTEVVVGALIIGIVAGGLLAVFFSVRKYVERSNNRLVAANLARGYLNSLVLLDAQKIVNLRENGTKELFPPRVIDGYTYVGSYTVINYTEGNATEVVVNVTYYPLD